MRPRALVALALVFAACTATNPAATATPSPTREPGALNVTVLLDLSGSRAPHGGPQREAVQLWTDRHGSETPRVRHKIVDVAGSPAKTALELRRAAVDDRADALIVGVPVEYDEAFASAVQLAQVPVLFTLPIPEPATAGGGWAFALAPTPAQLARATLDDAAGRGLLDTTLVVSDESSSAIAERAALVKELARRGLTPTVVTVAAADAAQRLRPMLASAPIVFFAGAPRPYVDAARAAPIGTPIYLSYICDLGEVGELRDATALAAWPGSRWIATSAMPGSSARVAFMQAYTDRAGPPTTPAASVYDALTLLANAAEGGITPASMRDRLESQTVAGVATTYSFTPSRHAGFRLADLALLRYTAARAAPVVR